MAGFKPGDRVAVLVSEQQIGSCDSLWSYQDLDGDGTTHVILSERLSQAPEPHTMVILERTTGMSLGKYPLWRIVEENE